jgi:subtilisin family serine protease
MFRLVCFFGFAIAFHCLTSFAADDEPLRIRHLERCGDLFDAKKQEVCVYFQGATGKGVEVRLGEKVVAKSNIHRDGDRLRVELPSAKFSSGPLWLEQGAIKSNAVWLSMNGSHVLAAHENDVVKNADGINTYLNLVSVIIEEKYDGLQESQALAKKYQATVVGMIPPLNLYQLRLPANNLTERDALVLRLGGEVSVDAVVIEETSPEKDFEGEAADSSPVNDEWESNRFMDAVDFYRRFATTAPKPLLKDIRIGVIERDVDFDAPDFAEYIGGCKGKTSRTCVYARDAQKPDDHGSTVAGVLAAQWHNGGNSGFLRGMEPAGPNFEIIVDRNSDGGITATIAASVNLVQDGVKVLNWSWGFHRLGTKNIADEELDSALRSGIAISGYEELLEEFFLWLRSRHPDVIVVNSAGNAAAFSGQDEYRLPSSLVTEQLLVVGGHERNKDKTIPVANPEHAVKRHASNVDNRVDITAAACVTGSTQQVDSPGKRHCGTSYATPLVAATIAAMLSINPDLQPAQVRTLLRRSAMVIGAGAREVGADFESPDADDLTSPILPSERGQQLDHPDIGRSARLDMHKALDLAAQSLKRVR